MQPDCDNSPINKYILESSFAGSLQHFLLLKMCDVGDPRALIAELCQLFYNKGWATGTGGGFSLKQGYVILGRFEFESKQIINPQAF